MSRLLCPIRNCAFEQHAAAFPDHQLAIRIHAPREVEIVPQISNTTTASHSHLKTDDSYLLISRFSLNAASDTASVQLGISLADWKTIARAEDAQHATEIDAGEHGPIGFSAPEPDATHGGATVHVSHPWTDVPYRAIAIDDTGKRHGSNNVNVNRTNDDCVSSYSFQVAPETIRTIEFHVRELDKIVEMDGISLAPGNRTTPKITMTTRKRGN